VGFLSRHIVAYQKGLWPRWRAVKRTESESGDLNFVSLVRRRMAYDRRSILIEMVDKVRVREIVSEKTPSLSLPDLIRIYESATALSPISWPEQVVVKPSHGSGGAVFVTAEPISGVQYNFDAKSAPLWNSGFYGFRTGDVDVHALVVLARRWLKSDYSYWRPRRPEWAYSRVKPRILVEKYLEPSVGEVASELRVHCFWGEPRFLRLTSVTDPSKPSLNFLPDGHIVAARLPGDGEATAEMQGGWDLYEEAMAHSRKLSDGIDYVRVDFLVVGENLYFSELTPYPNGGVVDFQPQDFSQWLADCWRSREVSPVPPHLMLGKIPFRLG